MLAYTARTAAASIRQQHRLYAAARDVRMQGFRHVVLLKWKPETTPATVADIRKNLEGLPTLIPQIQAYKVGEDAKVSEGNADFAIVADFANEADYKTYAVHPEHVRVIGMIKAALAPGGRAAVQYHT